MKTRPDVPEQFDTDVTLQFWKWNGSASFEKCTQLTFNRQYSTIPEIAFV